MAIQQARFDSEGFFKALESTVLSRGLRWKDVSQQTGIGVSTLSRMAQGRGPDASSLAILSAWAGLNPADFAKLPGKSKPAEPLAMLSATLRRDPNLTEDAIVVLDQVIRATYKSLLDKRR